VLYSLFGSEMKVYYVLKQDDVF